MSTRRCRTRIGASIPGRHVRGALGGLLPIAAAACALHVLSPARALAQAPSDADSDARSAQRAFVRGDLAAARRAADRCLAADPNRFDCLRVAIASRTRVGLFDQAAPLVAQCVLRQPSDRDCRFALVSIALHRGDVDAAAREVRELERVDRAGRWAALAAAMVDDARGDAGAARLGMRRACAWRQPYACRRLRELGALAPGTR